MNRRDFVQNSVLAGLAIGKVIPEIKMTTPQKAPSPFRLKFAPHLGMFKHHASDDPLAQLDFMAEVGFTAFEDNEMRNRTKELQNSIAKRLEKHAMEMGVLVAHKIYWKEPNLTSGKQAYRDEFLGDITSSVEVAQRVNAKWMTVVPGHIDLSKDIGYQTSNLVETLKQASAILEPSGITMVLEPLNFRNHPGQFLQKTAQAYEICKAVNSPSCKILFDIYHQQIQEGNLIPNIDMAWDEIAYFQVGDNPGRKEPTTGEINYSNVFQHIKDRGFEGIVGMEHGNSIEGKAGELKVIDAYKSVNPN
ncbi:MAG: TIM barrel protein [Saprospiraceae bacterium]|nr:TIM barrel protein [Saprospiraceae bacterium]